MASSVDEGILRAKAAIDDRRFGEAAGICHDILAVQPDHAIALAFLGFVYGHLKQPERGIPLLERAIGLYSEDAAWFANLMVMYRQVHRLDDALSAGLKAVELEPESSDHLYNLSLAFTDADQDDKAFACLLRAIGLNHEHADAHVALAQRLLAHEEYEAGWKELHWCNRMERAQRTMPVLTSAPWTGMRLPEGRLLLIADQGHGDAIHFCRYIPMIAERCKELIVACDPVLEPVLSKIPGVFRCSVRWDDIEPHAVYCRMTDVPGIFNTTMETIPPAPYLRADEGRVAYWRSRLPRDGGLIGLVWAGSKGHPNDRQRSMRLESLRPLLSRLTNVVCLQKPVPERDRGLLDEFGMVDLSDDLTDFGETAALIENLDLVIGVDTSTVHLAGALGKPVWIMLAKTNDWRWGLGREESLWYPTATLFRQPALGDWGSVVNEVARRLQ